MNIGAQVLAITVTNLRNIPARLGNSLVIVIGMAGVVGVLIPIIAMSTGFRATIEGDGRADRAVVTSRAATDEDLSSVSRDDLGKIANAAEVRRNARGESLASAEVVLQAPVARKRDHSDVRMTLRGVSARYFEVRPELKLVAGRMYQSGKHELI